MTLGISTLIEEMSPATLFGPVANAAVGSKITNEAFLTEAVNGKTLGLTQDPKQHLDRVFRGKLNTEGAISFTQTATQRPASPTGPKAKGQTLDF